MRSIASKKVTFTLHYNDMFSDIGDQDILDEAKAIHMKKNDNLASNSHKKTDLALSPANLRYYHKVNISSLSHWNYEHSSSMERLLQQMGSNWHFEWIKQRLKKMWPEFLEAGKALVGDCLKNKSDTTRKVSSILLSSLLTTNLPKSWIFIKESCITYSEAYCVFKKQL